MAADDGGMEMSEMKRFSSELRSQIIREIGYTNESIRCDLCTWKREEMDQVGGEVYLCALVEASLGGVFLVEPSGRCSKFVAKVGK